MEDAEYERLFDCFEVLQALVALGSSKRVDSIPTTPNPYGPSVDGTSTGTRRRGDFKRNGSRQNQGRFSTGIAAVEIWHVFRETRGLHSGDDEDRGGSRSNGCKMSMSGEVTCERKNVGAKMSDKRPENPASANEPMGLVALNAELTRLADKTDPASRSDLQS